MSQFPESLEDSKMHTSPNAIQWLRDNIPKRKEISAFPHFLSGLKSLQMSHPGTVLWRSSLISRSFQFVGILCSDIKPPFTEETAQKKVKAAQDLCNTRCMIPHHPSSATNQISNVCMKRSIPHDQCAVLVRVSGWGRRDEVEKMLWS
ncbi:hypothetical protein CISG_09617 [Coccidioides immitis RMSCC 3703]|uniref:Uncharacterized protein n=2 Tax=Coccidioides immitis TaxID=5501 RepID=A0A0J8U5A2_COCIT|nr:hypothetical protein CIRG_02600 [Coccidioides immitis RMSCC 2394]KMU82087.1 hypothetical protein CISG_09617 [Coccidioides immitis RMSCC 3703]